MSPSSQNGATKPRRGPGPPITSELVGQPRPTGNIAVRVLLFASARELAGAAEARFPYAGRSLAELRQHLASVYGEGFGELLACCATWVNGEPARPEQLLAPGDEVAVLPPVSGG